MTRNWWSRPRQFDPELVELFCRLVAERDEATEHRGEHVLDV